jgi:hypothetical protein
MKWQPIAQKAGKAIFFTICGVTGAFSISTILAAWIMVRPGSKKNYDCIPRISYGTASENRGSGSH